MANRLLKMDKMTFETVDFLVLFDGVQFYSSPGDLFDNRFVSVAIAFNEIASHFLFANSSKNRPNQSGKKARKSMIKFSMSNTMKMFAKPNGDLSVHK